MVKGQTGKMGRPVKLALALVVIIGLMFFFAGLSGEKPIKRIEKPVTVHAPA